MASWHYSPVPVSVLSGFHVPLVTLVTQVSLCARDVDGGVALASAASTGLTTVQAGDVVEYQGGWHRLFVRLVQAIDFAVQLEDDGDPPCGSDPLDPVAARLSTPQLDEARDDPRPPSKANAFAGEALRLVGADRPSPLGAFRDVDGTIDGAGVVVRCASASLLSIESSGPLWRATHGGTGANPTVPSPTDAFRVRVHPTAWLLSTATPTHHAMTFAVAPLLDAPDALPLGNISISVHRAAVISVNDRVCMRLRALDATALLQ